MSQHFHGYYFNWSLLGTELCPLKIHMLNSNPSTSEWDLLWKTGHFKCNQLRWSHTGGGWTPNPVWLVSVWKGELGDKQAHMENTMWKWRQRLGCCSQSRGRWAEEHQLLPATGRSREGGREQILPHSPQKGPALPTAWLILDFSLKKGETITFHCLSPSARVTSLQQPEETNTVSKSSLLR